MTAPTTPAAPQGAPAAPAQPSSSTESAISAARARIAEGGGLLPDADAESTTLAAPAPGSDAPPTKSLAVTLPGLEERGEKPLELEAPDQETYERLNRLNNEATIGRGVKAEQQQIEHLRRDRTELEDKIALDPAGFVLEKMQGPDRTEIAMQLFFEPAVTEAIQAKLKEAGYEGGILDVLESPDALRTLRAELQVSHLESRGQREELHARRRQMESNAREVIAEIDRLIPVQVTGERRGQLLADAAADVKQRAQRLGLTQIDVRDVPLIIGPRLSQITMYSGAPRTTTPAVPPKPQRPAASAGEQLPVGTEKRIELARKVGLRRLVEMARRTTTDLEERNR